MKSEERHQLLQNDLQTVTAKTVEFLERHLVTLIAIVCGVLLVVAVAVFWNRSSQSENAAGWTMLDSASNLEEFGTVVDKFKGKPPGQWAQLQISEKTLQSAMPLMFTDRDIALNDLKRAREGFESLVQDKTVPPVIRERALWGLALCLETGCDGDTTRPIEAYLRLLSDFPDSIFKTVAEERVRSLTKPSAREFYTWFSQENPKPPEARPRDGAFPPGFKMPDDDSDDFLPGLLRDKKPGTSEKSDPAPDRGDKKDGEPKLPEKPDAEKPDAEKPDAEKPADGENLTGKESPNRDEKPPEKN